MVEVKRDARCYNEDEKRQIAMMTATEQVKSVAARFHVGEKAMSLWRKKYGIRKPDRSADYADALKAVKAGEMGITYAARKWKLSASYLHQLVKGDEDSDTGFYATGNARLSDALMLGLMLR